MRHRRCIFVRGCAASYKPRGRRNNYKTTSSTDRSNTLGSASKLLPSRFAIHPRLKSILLLSPFPLSLIGTRRWSNSICARKSISTMHPLPSFSLPLSSPHLPALFHLNVLSALDITEERLSARQTNQIHHDTRACPFDNVTMENAIFPSPCNIPGTGPPDEEEGKQRRQTANEGRRRKGRKKKKGRKHDGQIGDARSREFPEGVFQFNVR